MIGLILLVAVPLIEIALLIKVGQWLGFWPTLGLVVATFIGGAIVIGRSGFTSAMRLREALVRGEAPVAAMLESALVVLAGVLLMTPGFVADAVGLGLLIPPLRRWLAGLALRNVTVVGGMGTSQSRFDTGAEDATTARGNARHTDTQRPEEPGDGPVIDGEFERLDERPMRPRRGGGEPGGEPGDRG